MNTEKQVARLVKEWKKHKGIIIGCDFDDTIYPYNFSSADECEIVLDSLRKAQSLGATITINTASIPSRFEFITNYCIKNGLNITGINSNHIELPFGKNGKIYANIFIDDRGGLAETLNTLNMSIEQYEKERELL